ncbi:hypothetical protein T472_0202850 [Youngiibacter fragilis 232.1]|uniref:Uncharacterized protein n=1 Tax=Youngiibacter fragilis 232.1 TaxID=994573 RepID=V7IA09_9CLOT|nr:hypothetical protein T472_0202850 [Youngiibacter fragilis 232.1]
MAVMNQGFWFRYMMTGLLEYSIKDKMPGALGIS